MPNASGSGGMASSSPALWSRLKKCKVCKRRKKQFAFLRCCECSLCFLFISNTRWSQKAFVFWAKTNNILEEENSVRDWRAAICCGCGSELKQTTGWLLQAQKAHSRGAAGLCYYTVEEKSCFVDGAKSMLGLSCANYTMLCWLCCFDETFISTLNHQ